MKILRFLGSLYLAVFLMAALVLTLTASTLLESLHGTPFAQKFFYQAGWFDVLLALLGVNIFCSALLRWPFKKHHTGFVITHAGILMLLAGSLLARLAGAEGQIALFEGENRDRITQEGYVLVAHPAENRRDVRSVELRAFAGRDPVKLDISDGRTEFFIHRVVENAVESVEINEGPSGGTTNRAVRLTLKSERAGFEDSFWLVERNPFRPQSRRIDLGPAVIELKERASEKTGPNVKNTGLALRIAQQKTGEEFRIALEPPPAADVPLGGTGLTVTDVRYFPDARVENGELVTVSDKPLNPAVTFEVFDKEGHREKHTRFVLFPEFESLHGRERNNFFDLAAELDVPSLPAETERRPHLVLFQSGGSWRYESRSSRGELGGALEAGRTYPAGWMDFAFRVDRLLERAVVSRNATETPGKGGPAAEVSAVREGKLLQREWIFPDRPADWNTPDGRFVLALASKTQKVPFILALKDFRKVDYPGTQSAASYESDVILHDPDQKLTLEKTIKMNKPLDYLGWRIFQSSYIQDPERGEASVFTVAKNPGIPLIYSGACTILVGVILLFYLHPFFGVAKKNDGSLPSACLPAGRGETGAAPQNRDVRREVAAR